MASLGARFVTRRRDHILIAGAGLGGLSLALGLLRAGFAVTVLEQAEQLREVGAGVSLAPNATRCLTYLGVLEAARRHGHVPDSAAIKHYQTGERLSGYAMGDAMESKWGSPYVQIHRAALQDILARAVLGHDPNALRLGARVTDLHEAGSGIEVQTVAGTFCGDYLIGADGVRSRVRTALHGDGAPHFLGYVAWRAVVPIEAVDPIPLAPDTAVFIGPRKSLLRYMLAGRTQVNIVMFAQDDVWTQESWTQPADHAEIRTAFADWSPEATALIEAVCRSGAFKWGLFGRTPLRAWQRGRATLIGDAAHPMLPFLGQGAAMAIEDAVVLTRAFSEAAASGRALAVYERARFERAMTTVARANTQGLRIHGYVGNASLDAPVPRDDFAEYGFDASAVALPSAECA
jgi:salicylate hydroxylase